MVAPAQAIKNMGKMDIGVKKITLVLLALYASWAIRAQTAPAASMRALVIIAHPDDESILAVTLYKIAKEHHGLVDLFVITDGEAGYKYAALAETYYDCRLTDAEDGRKRLPAIRRRELKRAGKILGVSHYYFAHQRDDKYCTDEKDALDSCWDVPAVKKALAECLRRGRYDYIFCLLPEAGEHGAHKAATLLALDAVAAMAATDRPVILGAMTSDKGDSVTRFRGYLQYQRTIPVADTALFKIDRTTHFSYNNRLDYKVIANWELAEHKSQGATQMTMNTGDLEQFWYFRQDNPGGIDRCRGLFAQLQTTPYAAK
jgi:N-acetylglucosamine malate deacetylase 2